MGDLKVLISKEDLEKRVAELAAEISAKERIDLVVGVLTGAFIFVADLVRDVFPEFKGSICEGEQLRKRDGTFFVYSFGTGKIGCPGQECAFNR